MEKLQSNFSTTNSSLPKQPLYAGGFLLLDAEHWTFIIATLLVLICLFGLVGNLCVIAILLHNARKAKPSLIHSLILNLAISDLLLLLFAVPFRAASFSRSSLNMGWLVCKTTDWFTHACMSAKSITIAITAKACYMYASNPAKQVNIGNLTILALLMGIWVVSAVLPLPEWFFTDASQVDNSFACLMNVPEQAQEMMATFVKLFPVLVYCIPFTIAFLYFWKAYGQCQRRGTKTQNLRNQIRSRRLTLMLLSVTVTFSILWLPEWVCWLWKWHQQPRGPAPPQVFLTFAHILMFSLSFINPLIFLVMSEEFKEGFKDVWKHLTSKKSLHVQDIQDQGPLSSEVLPDSSTPSPGLGPPEKPETNDQIEQSSLQNFGSQDSKENPVLPDVEQFWHGREANPLDQDNDPTPWEHEGEHGTIVSSKSDTNTK
ncbi:G-protein coupled receptor 151 [Hyperolius riggenbachi]|uniref:G-protein coupled receptor 151 n=1 Tax=Hyperolius riggenbachi TaxID=752182 RepID=UPI0035A30014